MVCTIRQLFSLQPGWEFPVRLKIQGIVRYIDKAQSPLPKPLITGHKLGLHIIRYEQVASNIGQYFLPAAEVFDKHKVSKSSFPKGQKSHSAFSQALAERSNEISSCSG